jgi:hypothetical protein
MGSCKHLQEIVETCQRSGVKLSSTEVIRMVCPTCGTEEVCPTLLCDQYDAITEKQGDPSADE